ncbi:putative integral membrane protein [Babesia bovis T2Bo]|uniref:putative integral membrane protein n=1 Tax=Babesia bovis T2Bo TaxID=484906 RepID=UPI001C368CA8|nr:putative integral membrane protein [Babesia bovis T2Bo]KAG6440202.1 putative integral membrane protein [Babesia bovis T2Bo]
MNITDNVEIFTHRINAYLLFFSIAAYVAYLGCPKFYVFYGLSKLIYVIIIAQGAFTVFTLGLPAAYVAALNFCIWSLIVRGLQVLIPALHIQSRAGQSSEKKQE